MSRFHVWTIGCQMNKADSVNAISELRRRGHELVERREEADILILNTCVVRQSAEDRVVGYLSSLKPLKRTPVRRAIVVMGCFVDDIPSLRRRFPYVDAFVAPSDVEGLVGFVEGWSGERKPELPVLMSEEAPVVSLLPVAHGCDHHCTYCIVTLRRGPQRSRPVEELAREARELVARGARELVLLGQNVDSYGRDIPSGPDLGLLLRAVHDIEGLRRIRFLTSHPADMHPEIIEAVAQLPRVCEHFELAVQAGDDTILKRMARGYRIAQFRELVGDIRRRIPGASIATDVIVGFPGESSEQFESTVELVEDLRFDAVHIACYSPRPGTAAARLEDDVPGEEKVRRRRSLEAIQERILGEINRELVGRTVEILVDGTRRGRWRGRTRTNKLVFFDAADDWLGRLARVEITWAGPWSMRGVVRGQSQG